MFHYADRFQTGTPLLQGPFEETVARARELVAAAIATEGSFSITCLSGILVCRP
jgi:hypothetical protein